MREVELLRLPDAVLLAAAHADRQESLSAAGEDGGALDWLSVGTLRNIHAPAGVPSDACVRAPLPALLPLE